MGIINALSQALGYDGTMADAATIYVGGFSISGWERVSIRVGVEIMPWAAMFETTKWQPTTTDGYTITINEEDSCRIQIGNDPVLTGYVQTVDEEVGPEEHSIRLVVTSRSIDATECSAEFSTYQMNNTTVLAIAQQVCKPFDITVKSLGGAGSTSIQQFSVILTETAYEVIERATRLAGCLFYDQPDGSILLAPIGTAVAGALVLGRNVERARFMRSMNGRYSKIQAILQTTAVLFEAPKDGNKQAQEMQALTAPSQASATDPGVTRYRPMLVPVETGDANYAVAAQRVQWEVARRYGRSRPVELVCDSWRDSNGRLWQPNTLAPIDLGKLGLSERWLIAEVEFVQGADGTHANIVAMPAEAFKPQPLVLPMAQNEGVAAATRNS
ncbi:MAG: phage baseplate assembly protein [Acetobacter sp.]|uniref:phage baseplate assembly protein n=1 Tax=Acetobacter sp. TaxID=440 RepID=UPI0039E8BC6C